MKGLLPAGSAAFLPMPEGRGISPRSGEDDLFVVAHHLGHQRQRTSLDQRSIGLLQYLKEMLGNPMTGLQLMIDRVQDNLLRFKAKQPLIDHLLQYLTAEEAAQEGLNFHEEQGWIEELES